MAKITLEQIKEEISVDGWQLLSTEYKNLTTQMTFECPHGHQVFAPWQKLRTRRDCPVCKRYSRGYIRHLFKAREMLGMRLCVLHNLYFYNTLMEKIREALAEGRYESFYREMRERLSKRVDD